MVISCFPTYLQKCLARRLYISISEGKGNLLDFVECFILLNSSNSGEFPKSFPKALQTVDLNSQLVQFLECQRSYQQNLLHQVHQCLEILLHSMTQGDYNGHSYFGDFSRLMIGMLNNYHLRHDVIWSCTIHSGR